MRRALLLCACLVVAGCGANGPKRLSADEYAKRANAVCARFHRQVNTLGLPRNLRQLDRVTTRTLPLLRDATRQLRKLRPPKANEATARRWLSSLDVLADDLVKLRERARANDLAGVHRVADSSLTHNERSDRLATQLGATACPERR